MPCLPVREALVELANQVRSLVGDPVHGAHQRLWPYLAVIVVLGVIVGGMVVAMYLPIFDMVNAVQ